MTRPGAETASHPEAAPEDVPRASVIIPAYNEGRVIERCLASLRASRTPSGGPVPVQVIVSANACTDDTAQRARQPGVTVLDRREPGKIGALNAADAAATCHPRIYLDADIELSPEALYHLCTALHTDAPRIASPTYTVSTSHSSWPVRQFYRMFMALPYASSGLVGLGVYGMSRSGRARFEQFPQVTADDLFVQRLFPPRERLITAGTFTVHAPRTLADLVAVRTRIARGNAELAQHDATVHAAPEADFSSSTAATLTALVKATLRRPSLLPAAAIYIAVTLAARRRARTAPSTWNRDSSTR